MPSCLPGWHFSFIMKREDCIEIGYIPKAHGLKGELKAVFDVYDIQEYKRIKSLFLAKKDQPLKEYTVTKFQIVSRESAIIGLGEITDRNQAEELIPVGMYFPADQLPKLPEGQFYYFDVIGFTVKDKQLGTLGTVRDFADGPAQDLMIMDYQDKEVLIPVTDHFVLNADMDAKIIHTDLPEGLLEFYLEGEG